MIKAVLFDFRDTLIDVRKAYADANAFILQQVHDRNHNISPAKAKEELESAIAYVRKISVKNNPIMHDPTPLFLKRFFKRIDLKIDQSSFEKLLHGYDKKFISATALYDDSHEALESLHKKKILLGVVIDGMPSRSRGVIEHLNLG